MLRKISLAVLILLSAAIANAQISKDDFLKIVQDKQYPEAVKYIPQIQEQYLKDAKMLCAFGNVYAELDEFANATKYFQMAYKNDDENAMVARRYAMALANQQNYQEALKVIRNIIKDKPKDLYNHLTAADIYIKMDSLAEAEIAIDRARSIDKNNPAPIVTLGNLYYSKRVYELARQNYEEAIGLDSSNNEAHMNLAISYYWLATREMDKDLSNELFTRSLKEWNTVSQLDSMNAKAFFEQGKIWFFAEKYPEAATALSRFIKLRPNGSLGRWYLAESLHKLGECESAITHLLQVREEIDSIRSKATKYLSDCYISTKQYPEAKRIFAELEANNYIFDPADLRKFGQALFFSGDTTMAIQYWNKSIAMDKDQNCALMYVLGTIQSAIKQYDESNKVLKLRLETTACQNEPNLPKVYYTIGQNYLYNSQPDSAITYLTKAYELEPKNIFTLLFLGDAYVQMKDMVKGKEYYQQVVTLYKADTTLNKQAVIQSFAKQANTILENKNYNELNKLGKQWTELLPDNVFGFLYYAVSFQGLNDGDNACINYGKVLKLDPENVTAKKNRELIGCGKK